MPVERTSSCPICFKETYTVVKYGIQVQHGECWKRELKKRYETAPTDSHIRKAIMDTLKAIKENEKLTVGKG